MNENNTKYRTTMNESIVQYRIPKCTELVFLVSPQEKYLTVKLLDGSAKMQFNEDPKYLRLGREYAFPLWGHLNPRLKTTTGCEITVQGNHYVYSAITIIEGSCKNLFGVSFIENSYVFFLEGYTQLQVLVDVAPYSDVFLKVIRGEAETFGYPLDLKKKYCLLPCTSLIVRPQNKKSCTVCIEGCRRRIKISLLDKHISALEDSVHTQLHELRLKAIENENHGPVVLVIGSPNVGRTSLCRFLLNKALENCMKPVYIDLDVRRNTNTIPGALSLTKPIARSSSIMGFSFSEQSLLYFGSTTITENNIPFYHLLIRSMGEIFSKGRTLDRNSYSGAIIDASGALSYHASTINCIFQSFPIDLVVVIGDKILYDDMKKDSLLKNIETEFIPKPQTMEAPNPYREVKAMELNLQNYFSVEELRFHEIYQCSFADLKIYKIITFVSGHSGGDAKVDFRVEAMICHPGIERHVLGVSQSTSVDEFPSVTQVKSFVYFTKVDLQKKVAHVLSPEGEGFRGKILILGDVKVLNRCNYLTGSN